MSIFATIMHKIFSAVTDATQTTVLPAATVAAQPPPDSPGPTLAPPPAVAPAAPVDVQAVLAQMATTKGGGGNWQSSIVDLLKLLDLDSSLAARKELAGELNVHAGADGSAEENIALHQAVMRKLAENGGKVPEAMKG